AGISIFAIGLFKKCVIADHFAIYADQVFGTATSVPSLFITEAWFGALSYTLQIYFDFSAYSDMAVGISLLFGIRLPQNFNSPYQATSIIDFWRRWHISLSNFLRDYLYIPLGGNRKGPARRYINLLLTMVLGGLWHGAGWTFLLWGGLHGVYLCANHAWQKLRITLPRLISFAITFMAVVFAWVVFRAENLQTVAAMLKPMVAGMIPQLSNLFPYFSYTMVDIVWLASGLLSVWLLPNIYQMFGAIKPALPPKSLTKPALPTVSLKWAVSPAAAIVCALTMAIGIAAMGGYSPFLYFRF
ncbi:MAG TPA: MBOAT family O-acyltransferase, partial [Alphaproteobacteria bacterium]